jgi:hypothetical protein
LPDGAARRATRSAAALLPVCIIGMISGPGSTPWHVSDAKNPIAENVRRNNAVLGVET